MKTVAVISRLEKEADKISITLSSIAQYTFKLPDEANARHNLFYTVDAAGKITIDGCSKTKEFGIDPALEAFATELYFKRVAAEFTVDGTNITAISVRDFE
ncbi:hypothetical protein D3C81_1965180 [compost metagenome]